MTEPTRTPAYDLVGEGPTVLFLHSFPLDRAMWSGQLDALSRAGFRAIALDFPGFGETPLAHCSPPDLDAYVSSVLALLDTLHVERPLIVGLSLGGYVALRLVAQHPDRVGALVLADTHAGADSPTARASRVVNLSLVRSKGPGALIRKMLPLVLSPTASENTVSNVISMAERQSPEGVAFALLAMRDRHDHTVVLPAISTPTLCLAGELDTITTPTTLESLSQDLQHSRFVGIPSAGHLSNLDAPERFGQEIVRFANEYRTELT